jgi:uncharacterized protein (DUF3084 family)
MNEPCAHERDYTTTQAMKSYVAASVLAGDAAIERDALKAEVERLTAERDALRLRLDAEQTRRAEARQDAHGSQEQRDEARATLAKVAAIVADPAAALVADRVRAALEPTDLPKGTK